MGTGDAVSAASSSSTTMISDLLQWLSLSKVPPTASSSSPSTVLTSILFPTLPPVVQTMCSLCRLISFLIVAPIVIVAVVDFAEYAVIRTLGLRRRKVRVKPSGSTSNADKHQLRMQLSPAQLRRQTTLQSAPLLTPGAYDAETLLRHRARSISSASSEALEEWTRSNGSFARVAEVRAANSASNSQAPSPPGGNSIPSTPPHYGVARNDLMMSEGALGFLSESDAEGDDGSEPASPVVHTRQLGLKGSQFGFTPIAGSATKQQPKQSSPTGEREREPLLGIDPGQLSAAAAAADLERPSIIS